jgi:hypothetical protein
MSAEQLCELLTKQSEGIEAFGVLEQRMQRAVIAQEWAELDRVIPASEALAEQLELLDQRRHQLVSQMKRSHGVPPDAPFGELLVHLPAERRRLLATAFRGLQVAVLRVKSLTNGIDSYVRGAVKATNRLMHEVFPDHRGTLYSRLGRRSPADGRAIVLDRKL